LRNLEGEGDKGKDDLLHKSHVIIEYNIVQGWVWPKNESLETILAYLKVEGWTWPRDQSWGTKTTILPILIKSPVNSIQIVYSVVSCI